MQPVAERNTTIGSGEPDLFLPHVIRSVPVPADPRGAAGESAAAQKKLLWLGDYLRARDENVDAWILNDMGWFVDSAVQFLAEYACGTVGYVLALLTNGPAAAVPSQQVFRSPFLNIRTIRTSLTAQSVTVELHSGDGSTITGSYYDIDRALQVLLREALAVCAGVPQCSLAVRDYWNIHLLSIDHPATEIPPELFDFLFDTAVGNGTGLSDSLVHLVLSVQECSVEYRMERDDVVVVNVSLTLSLALSAWGRTLPERSVLPLFAVLHCSLPVVDGGKRSQGRFRRKSGAVQQPGEMP